MSDWVEDASEPSGWRWDKDAPSPREDPALSLLSPRPLVDPDSMPPETAGHHHGGDE